MKTRMANIPTGEPPHEHKVQAALDALEAAQNLLDYASRCVDSLSLGECCRSSAIYQIRRKVHDEWHTLNRRFEKAGGKPTLPRTAKL